MKRNEESLSALCRLRIRSIRRISRILSEIFSLFKETGSNDPVETTPSSPWESLESLESLEEGRLVNWPLVYPHRIPGIPRIPTGVTKNNVEKGKKKEDCWLRETAPWRHPATDARHRRHRRNPRNPCRIGSCPTQDGGQSLAGRAPSSAAAAAAVVVIAVVVVVVAVAVVVAVVAVVDRLD